LDIRLLIGLMFGILGILLAGYGLLGDQSVYERSLGININLIWGAVLILFSMLLLFLGSRKARRRASPAAQHDAPSSRRH
jgi:multisubunit Na+/H+ antiporter MnhG subunit